MNAFQKQRDLRLIEGWDKVTKAVTPAATYFKGQQMAALLQELAEEPEPGPLVLPEMSKNHTECIALDAGIEQLRRWGLACNPHRRHRS